MAKHALVSHPDGPKSGLSIGCKVSCIGRDALKFEFVLIDPAASVRVPERGQSERKNDLWTTTCFEAFISRADHSYHEFNFSPSTDWASYHFESYRNGMSPALDWPSPAIFVEQDGPRLALTAIVEFPAASLAEFSSLAISAVIEETSGTKSYWALAHPPGKPDFHAPACFAATLPAPGDT